jgi:hypothetical protein
MLLSFQHSDTRILAFPTTTTLSFSFYQHVRYSVVSSYRDTLTFYTRLEDEPLVLSGSGSNVYMGLEYP